MANERKCSRKEFLGWSLGIAFELCVLGKLLIENADFSSSKTPEELGEEFDMIYETLEADKKSAVSEATPSPEELNKFRVSNRTFELSKHDGSKILTITERTKDGEKMTTKYTITPSYVERKFIDPSSYVYLYNGRIMNNEEISDVSESLIRAFESWLGKNIKEETTDIDAN